MRSFVWEGSSKKHAILCFTLLSCVVLQGADTIVWMASAPKLRECEGLFWFDRATTKTNFPMAGTASNKKERDLLWERCLELMGAKWVDGGMEYRESLWSLSWRWHATRQRDGPWERFFRWVCGEWIARGTELVGRNCMKACLHCTRGLSFVGLSSLLTPSFVGLSSLWTPSFVGLSSLWTPIPPLSTSPKVHHVVDIFSFWFYFSVNSLRSTRFRWNLDAPCK